MTKTTLKEFLQSGKLGCIALGMSRDEVRQALGEPDAKTYPKAKPEIWKYGDIQIAFETDILEFIGIYFDNGEVNLPQKLLIDGYWPSKETLLEGFNQFLSSESLLYKIDLDLTFGPQVCLVVGPGVDVIFNQNRISTIQFMNPSNRIRRFNEPF